MGSILDALEAYRSATAKRHPEGNPAFAGLTEGPLYLILPAMERDPCVYILASGFKRLYIGVTSRLMQRIFEHKNPEPEATNFAARYNITSLVYVENFGDMASAIHREKQLKGWSRQKKIALIVASNPTWRDLSEDWGKPVELYRGD